MPVESNPLFAFIVRRKAILRSSAWYVPRRRYMLLLREFLEPHIVHIRIILKYASIQGFIQVLWPTKLYYALCIELVALLADRGE